MILTILNLGSCDLSHKMRSLTVFSWDLNVSASQALRVIELRKSSMSFKNNRKPQASPGSLRDEQLSSWSGILQELSTVGSRDSSDAVSMTTPLLK